MIHIFYYRVRVCISFANFTQSRGQKVIVWPKFSRTVIYHVQIRDIAEDAGEIRVFDPVNGM